ncbi:MAG: TerC family protein [Cyclobacteriaceae bacterium]|nr:TerC family protein [Cyclobacteriaceae bacterium]UYN88561.1 MAG: TerC family protein [Cyclobacteriaceae bacterium]
MEHTTLYWVAFNVFVLAMLVLDLGVFHRKTRTIGVREALGWTFFWIVLALLFNAVVYYQFGQQRAVEFFTGYLIEKSLSVDNIFVMLIIFSYFNVPQQYQHKVLFWGILGALVFRIIFIVAGIELISRFHWLIYLFGAFLVYTGIKLLSSTDEKIEPEKNPVLRFVRKIIPVTSSYHNDKFFTRIDGRLWATPLFLVVMVIEATDVVFAVDSIPAILAISNDSFIIYTSNVFAILGLRSLYFAMAGIQQYFSYLKYGLSIILVFVGGKMLLSELYPIPVEVSLLVILSILTGAIALSWILPKRSGAIAVNAEHPGKAGHTP